MQIALGKKGDYAVRAALHLAVTHAQGRQKAREIAAATDVPDAYLPQVLATLVRAELVSSVAGPRGGYALAKRPEEISLLDVVEAAEGHISSDACLLRGGACGDADACAVHGAWSRAQQALADQLHDTSLAELAARRRRDVARKDPDRD